MGTLYNIININITILHVTLPILFIVLNEELKICFERQSTEYMWTKLGKIQFPDQSIN